MKIEVAEESESGLKRTMNNELCLILKKKSIICMLNFSLLNDMFDYHSVFKMIEKKNLPVPSRELELHTIELPKFQSGETKRYRI